METTLLIAIKDQQVLPLLQQLEALKLIKLLDQERQQPFAGKRSGAYKGVFSKEDAQSFDAHTLNMRKEWNDTLPLPCPPQKGGSANTPGE